ncbi:MAG TPA: NFACT family protein [Pyrinomonadaceae bacterium]|nr:NFACT family protein [Pyrinomonadaceae bacterium]
MNLATIAAIRQELANSLVGNRLGKIFQLSRTDLAIDFRLPDSRYLFVSTQPGNPRTYLINRRLRDLEKAQANTSAFVLVAKKRLSGATATSIQQVTNERVLLIGLDAVDDLGNALRYSLSIQLTGTSANVFLLDDGDVIVESLKPGRGDGQQVGEKYTAPERHGGEVAWAIDDVPKVPDLSSFLDALDVERASAERFRSLAAAARGRLKREISKRERLLEKLGDDLANHGDAENWKRLGDLLLANVATAKRDGGKVLVTDYFNAHTPEIEIAVNENDSVTEAAEKFFKRYTKARNAGKEIESRIGQINEELAALIIERDELEEVIAAGDEDDLRKAAGPAAPETRSAGKRKRAEKLPGVRIFISSDGFEILVGKKAKDNDFLTLRVAKSLDTWMHAADYPGSHVVIRNSGRKEVPHQTLLEAAQLAAFYSQGKSQPKAAVHYTQKKFVNKPKGSAPGLVSLASFKTLLVEPKVGVEMKG